MEALGKLLKRGSSAALVLQAISEALKHLTASSQTNRNNLVACGMLPSLIQGLTSGTPLPPPPYNCPCLAVTIPHVVTSAIQHTAPSLTSVLLYALCWALGVGTKITISVLYMGLCLMGKPGVDCLCADLQWHRCCLLALAGWLHAGLGAGDESVQYNMARTLRHLALGSQPAHKDAAMPAVVPLTQALQVDLCSSPSPCHSAPLCSFSIQLLLFDAI